ncbi:RNA polymerase sigma factor [Aridibaculum aurantiacum]|uniref:RNA polymerase sigma factor n=1 Tax=Aridibaculum aurantiacum TaxID=2810307 RepID=UPI001A96A1B2|nr:sigma-70 family RNA polymerase sigma factor [Aridibaculum aurantiacum]
MYEEVIQQIKKGDLEPLDKIYLEHKSDFIGFAHAQFPQIGTESIEDAYQDTIIDVYKNIAADRLTSIEYSFRTYIFHIGKTKLIKLADRQKKFEHTELTVVEEHVAYEATSDHNWQEVQKALSFVMANASDSCKQILKLFYFQKKSMSEIALALGYSNADTVKAKKNRCINQLSDKAAGMFNNQF